MIELENVTKRYGDTEAVSDVSFAAEAGEFLVLIGESGSGKTTMLNMLNRLIEPSRGRILIDGEDVLALDPVALRRRIGFVFQAIGLFPHMTVGENVGITPRLLGWPAEKVAGRVNELLDLVRMPADDYRDRFPAALSGGQKQRVGVARALAARPAIMLMDEPFGALDPVTRDELSADYRAIHDTLKLTTVLVTHDMTEAFLLADRIAVMRGGRLIQIGTPHELIEKTADDFVRQMIETPRRRAKRLAEAMETGA
jgi:osmoprotectant transport system ATP-binding protein